MQLYREFLIDTAEQVHKLPEGAHVVSDRGHKFLPGLGGDWFADEYGTGGVGVDEVLRSGGKVTALVPVEAEEETIEDGTYADPTRKQARQVTPWETTHG